MNAPAPRSVIEVMFLAARRVCLAAIVASVPAVPGFAQTHTRDNLVVLERATWTGAREYHPAAAGEAARLPANLIIAPTFESTVVLMLQRSATFRRQCLRIAQAPEFVVQLQRPGGRLPTGQRARTRLDRDGARRIAIVEVPALDNDVELIAHEIEHVVEQLDGIDLRSHADRHHSTVRLLRSDRLTFETERARRVGRIVCDELSESGAMRRAELGIRAHVSSPRR